MFSALSKKTDHQKLQEPVILTLAKDQRLLKMVATRTSSSVDQLNINVVQSPMHPSLNQSQLFAGEQKSGC